jgi:alkylation response protein AidB-like acyl-CoA dehydrogenase
MDFDLSEDQKEIKAVARELLAARSPFAKVREAAESATYDEALWRELVDLGWPGIAVSEQRGGQGLGIVELAVLLEELGYACSAVPFLSTAVAAAVIDRAGTDEQRERWLPGLIAGEARVGVGHPELIADGAGAELVLVLGGGALSAVTSAQTQTLETIDPTRRFAVLGGPPDGTALDGGAAQLLLTSIAAELVGVCQRALDMTLDYVKERKQFGVPVGSFQAVSHRAAEMLLHTESARSATYYAAWAAGAGPDGPDLTEAGALAAAAAATAGRETSSAAIQLHGGIGFTWEADVHWLFKRAEVDRKLLGGVSRHRATLAVAAARRLARD